MTKEEIIKQMAGSFKRVDHMMHHIVFRALSPKQKPGQLYVFMRLKRDEKHGNAGIRVSEIASSLGISVPAVTQIIGPLEKNGYIRREMDPEDRRAVRVFMTPEGSALMDPAFLKIQQMFEGLIDYLGEENSQTLMKLLMETETYFRQMTETKSQSGENACD